MKITLPVIGLVLVFLICGCATTGHQDKAKVSAEDYSYTDEPDICFFPRESAKWDGYEVNNKNWNKLTDFQKLMFIFEGSKEIERQKNVTVNIKDTNRALVALNFGLDKINQENPGVTVPVIDFLYDILNEAKMIAPR